MVVRSGSRPRLAHRAEPASRGGLNRQAAPGAPAEPKPPAEPAAGPGFRARVGPGRRRPGPRRGRVCSLRPRARRHDQVLDQPRGRACRTGLAPGHGLRSDRPGRRRHPDPGPGNRCGRGTRSAPQRRSSRPRGLRQPGPAPPSWPAGARESHRAAPGHARAPGRAQATHHSGDRGRRHAARRVPRGGLRAAGPARCQVLAHNPAGCPPVWERMVRAVGPPGNYACPRLDPFSVPDQGLPRLARRARRNRTRRPGRWGVRCRTPRLPRVSLRCRAPPGSPGPPASRRCPPGGAGRAPSRGTAPSGGPAASGGTAALGTHAGAAHRGTRVRDRRSRALAVHAAVPAGPRRSFVPLPCP